MVRFIKSDIYIRNVYQKSENCRKYRGRKYADIRELFCATYLVILQHPQKQIKKRLICPSSVEGSNIIKVENSLCEVCWGS